MNLWKSITSEYDLRPDEIEVLEQACHTKDRIVSLTVEAESAPSTVRGSMGQEVINPVVSELRVNRTTLAALLRQMKLPDHGEGTELPDSPAVRARRAAQTRWAGRWTPGLRSAEIGRAHV